MSFINYYNKSSHSYYATKKKAAVLYSVGTITVIQGEALGLITKLNSDGNLVWEKSYTSIHGNIIFEDFVYCDNDDIIVTGTHNNNFGISLFRIDQDGNVVWTKYFASTIANNVSQGSSGRIIKNGYETYILQIDDRFAEQDAIIQPLNFIYKLDYNGNVILQKQLSSLDGKMSFEALTSKVNNNIVLAGQIIKKAEQSSDAFLSAVIIELDAFFNVVYKYVFYKQTVHTGRTMVIHDILAVNQNYTIFGSYSDIDPIDNDLRSNSFIATINGHFISPIIQPAKVRNTYTFNKCFFGNNSLYLEGQDRNNTLIARFDYSFNLLWYKNIDSGLVYSPSLIKQITSNDVLISKNIIGSLNLNLESCLTTDLPIPVIVDETFTLSPTLDLSLSNTSNIATSEIPVVTAVASIKEEICPPNSGDPCSKDENLCQLRFEIQEILNDCLLHPDEIVPSSTFSNERECINNILGLVRQFNTTNPLYQLIKLNFSNQDQLISDFVDSYNIDTYTQAWYAIQSIISVLTNLGNCDCSVDTVRIKSNTLLQSPNFYVQSAGSIGEDSTKGIHVRWTFAGSLGDKHLPKGNYASTSFNFNKANDFVKIYRSPYSRVPFTLSFSEPPQTINDPQRYWLYKFNNNTRIFFIYFKNLAKYDQVRASIDPSVEPLDFIHAYGNELIEIENKRELFFAAKLLVNNMTQNSTLKAEALNVPENKLFVPKFLFSRKSFDSSELDNVKLLCENGRCVRFKPQNCTIDSLEFEFYSDFINNADTNDSWEVVGIHALSLEDSHIDTMLDPDPVNNAVHGKWLRYNDEAYVDTTNYQDKWNGPVESWNRNIKDTVSQYINLSDNEDNPGAVETFNINLGSENDIITVVQEPVEGGTQISNLDMLRIAAYDYHIARMLGLGMLDIGPEMFQGEYIYLGEYFTYAPIDEDTFGPIHHLSMTLPTSIYTQRLPEPVHLAELVPGFININGEEDNSLAVDENGYSYNGRSRYVSIFSEDLYAGEENPLFFANNNELDSSSYTNPVYAGLEHRKIFPGDTDTFEWEKPELAHDIRYLNIDETHNESYETTSLQIPFDGQPLYIHRQTRSGTYYYTSYGINWFSRATSSSIELSIETDIKPHNSLLPPFNVNAWLIRDESPLMFTSLSEQTRYDQITDNDKTLVRLTFDYNADNEIISSQIPLDTATPDSVFLSDTTSLFPDDDEIFGEDIEIFFRGYTPKTISAKIESINNNTSLFLSTINTEAYFQASTGNLLPSELPQGTTIQNFIGSMFSTGSQQYLINDVIETASGLQFVVYKKQISQGVIANDIPTINTQNLQNPYIEGEGIFMVVENMQSSITWGVGNPHSFKIKIGSTSWGVHRELVKLQNDNGQIYKYIEKTRGFWQSAMVEKVLEDFQFESPSGTIINKVNSHRGLYKVEFNTFQLVDHIQFDSDNISVEWFNGYVRLFTESNYANGELQDSRKSFKVFKTENIGTSNNLIVYFNDSQFQLNQDGDPNPLNNDVLIGSDILVNYYPSYKVYLYYNPSHHLTENIILPSEGEGVRYSIFGLRAVDYDYTNNDSSYYKSRFSVPAVLLAQEIIPALDPEKPLGGLYATRPDFFGKSTYTITTDFNHKPYSISFYRSDNQAFLSAIYEMDTIKLIKENLKVLGGNNEEYFTNRWENFLDFTELRNQGEYTIYPPEVVSEINYRLPLPDKIKFFEQINAFINYHNSYYNTTVPLISLINIGTLGLNSIIIEAVTGQNAELKLVDFVEEAIKNTFIPLTELPVIYRYINSGNYKPVNKKQNTRDRNGNLLNPNHPDFAMAPMMKIVSDYKVQFTDFTLDGTTSNVYFYAAKEIGSEMKMSGFSPILGPIKLVNTNAPEEPKIKSALPVLENRVLGIIPKVKFEMTAYPEIQNIKKINVYRTGSRIQAEGILSMDLVKVIDIDSSNLVGESIWSFTDDFENLSELPYGEPLYYRITVSRKVEYADSDQNVIVEYAPSQPSKILVTTIAETNKPKSPQIYYSHVPVISDVVSGIVLHWEKTCFNGKYQLYKMSGTGNWSKIYEIQSNQQHIYVPLLDTDLNNADLVILDSENKRIYHHFKVIAENTAGMRSSEENILTIFNDDFPGIGEMVIEQTFIVR